MLSSVNSLLLDGLEGRPVTVRVDVRRGRPAFAIPGLPEAAVAKTRERLRAALLDSGYEFPSADVVVDVTPLGARPEAGALDLAIAAALLSASGQLDWPGIEGAALVGGLAADGRVRPVDGALAIAEGAREVGITTLVAPVANGPEAALVRAVEVLPIEGLSDLRAFGWGYPPPHALPLKLPVARAGGPDLADLRGRVHLQYPLEVAVAGGHGLLLVGPRGSGRSMLASRLPSILPELKQAEALDIVRIAGATGSHRAPTTPGRPFRAPHHTISVPGLLGGGSPPRPGEVTMAHRGVLLLEDLDRFRRETIEALHPVLAAGEVTIESSGVRRRLPSAFQLVAASDPCPCGGYPGDCVCAPFERARFRARMTRGLGGHLPIRVEVDPPAGDASDGWGWQGSAVARMRVEHARWRMEARLGAGRTNAQMTSEEVRRVPLTSGAVRTLAAHQARRSIHRRAPEQAIRVAATVADLSEMRRLEYVGEEAMRLAVGLLGDGRS
ncbi:MAG TPA: ATP-binding protein [Solirubrobacterales bacterium]|nr:ATP-binding protein [Solirubrobacterales bacterium]